MGIIYYSCCEFRVANKETLAGKKKLIIYAFTIAFTFHAGYFGIAFIGMFWISLLTFSIYKKEYKSTRFLSIAFAISLVLTMLIYPNFLAAIGSDRGDEAMLKIDLSSIIQTIKACIDATPGQLERYYLGPHKLVAIFAMIAFGIAYTYNSPLNFNLNS